jgi:hypothetical protein
LTAKVLEPDDRALNGIRPPPIQQVAIEPVDAEPIKRPPAGGDGPSRRAILRQDLGDQEYLIATPGDRASN